MPGFTMESKQWVKQKVSRLHGTLSLHWLSASCPASATNFSVAPYLIFPPSKHRKDSSSVNQPFLHHRHP